MSELVDRVIDGDGKVFCPVDESIGLKIEGITTILLGLVFIYTIPYLLGQIYLSIGVITVIATMFVERLQSIYYGPYMCGLTLLVMFLWPLLIIDDVKMGE